MRDGDHAVILNSIHSTHNLNVLKSLYRSQKLQLYRLGERRGHSLQIQFLCVESARLNKKLMAFFIGEVHNFVFKARAIARPHAVNFSAVKR